METVKLLLHFLLSNWPIFGPVAYEIIARVWPTKWNISLLDNVWKIVNLLIKNKRVPDGTESVVGTDAKGQPINNVQVKVKTHILK